MINRRLKLVIVLAVSVSLALILCGFIIQLITVNRGAGMIRRLYSRDLSKRLKTIIYLGELGEEGRFALPYLVDILEREDESVAIKSQVLISIGNIGNPGDVGLSIILKFVCSNNDNRILKASAIYDLTKIGDPARQYLFRLLNEEANPFSKREKIEMIGILGFDDEQTISELIKVVSNDDEDIIVRGIIPLVLGNLGSRPEIITSLAGLLNNENTIIVENSIIALGRIGPNARDALGALRECLDSRANRGRNIDAEDIRSILLKAIRYIES